MSPRAAAIVEVFRSGFASLDKLDPSDVDAIVLACVGHLRQMRPEQFGCLSKLPAPTERIVDPRRPARERFPVLEWPDGMRYVDWHSRTHDDLIACATRSGLHTAGETVRLGWADRDPETGETQHTWLEEPRG